MHDKLHHDKLHHESARKKVDHPPVHYAIPTPPSHQDTAPTPSGLQLLTMPSLLYEEKVALITPQWIFPLEHIPNKIEHG